LPKQPIAFGTGKGWQPDRLAGTLALKYSQRRAKKAGLTHDLQNIHLSKELIALNLKPAYQMYQRLKRDPKQQDTWLGQLVDAQATARNCTKTIMVQSQAMEHIQTTTHQVKFTLG